MTIPYSDASKALIAYYESFDSNNISADNKEQELKLWMEAMTSFDSRGHENNQHSFPRFLLRKFLTNVEGNKSYHMDDDVFAGDDGKYTTVRRKHSATYKLLYSKHHAWSKDVEGWMTSVENLFQAIVGHYGLVAHHDFLNALNANFTVRASFIMLMKLSVYRAKFIFKKDEDHESWQVSMFDYDRIRLEDFQRFTSEFLEVSRRAYFNTQYSNLKLALNSNLVKPLPVRTFYDDNSELALISGLMVPVLHDKILTIGFFNKEINDETRAYLKGAFNSHLMTSMNLSDDALKDCGNTVFMMYNYLSIFVDSRSETYTDKTALLMKPLSPVYQEVHQMLDTRKTNFTMDTANF